MIHEISGVDYGKSVICGEESNLEFSCWMGRRIRLAQKEKDRAGVTIKSKQLSLPKIQPKKIERKEKEYPGIPQYS